jgi:hypothetical protein
MYNERLVPSLDPDAIVYLEVKGKKVAGKYISCTLNNNQLTCQALITTENGTIFSFSDIYIAKGSGIFELQRKVEIMEAASKDSYFNSLFGFRVDEDSKRLTDNEYFIPGVWYKGNFTATGNLPASIPQIGDTYFYYREDRIPLPLVMFREPVSGTTISIIHKDSEPETVIADAMGIYINENYQFGSLGIKQEDNIVYSTFLYPGSEADRRAGQGPRYHPIKKNVKHEYHLEISFSTTPTYAEAVKETWGHAFLLYNPTVYNVDLSQTYNGLIETLLTYYVPSAELGGIRDAAGFPFEVSLTTFQPVGIDYQMGFVGMQIATGYYLYREGIEKKDAVISLKGEAVLNFWARNSLTSLGYPRTWYDPGLNGNKGNFRTGSDIRVCTGGMEGLIAAWCFAKQNNRENPVWIDACIRFGDWLIKNQNTDGSYYFSYNHDIALNDIHPPSNYNKYLTPCAIRYLVELYIATGKEEYKIAALKAGNFCYANIHEKYMYVACVVDNPQTIDSESGQMALNGFLSLYDLTKERKWLNAAEQAATYTESWVYSFEIPVEKDRTGKTAFPKEKSIVGQHLIAIGHAAADLGFAWSSFAFYRLYLETRNEHYLKVARISAHNTKQSMNWDGNLYPGQAKGLQLEAFGVTIPRRVNGILTTLNWNYAAHLDPMFRFKDAFGTPDLEEVEKMTWEERQRLNYIYSQLQSANYGQDAGTGTNNPLVESKLRIYPNHLSKELTIDLPDNKGRNYVVEIYNLLGVPVFSKKNSAGWHCRINVCTIPSGHYIIRITGGEKHWSEKIII